MSTEVSKPTTTTAKVVVATTVALSFISFWRGASIVLSDLASSAFYAGGIAEIAIGPAAPWFVLDSMSSPWWISMTRMGALPLWSVCSLGGCLPARVK